MIILVIKANYSFVPQQDIGSDSYPNRLRCLTRRTYDFRAVSAPTGSLMGSDRVRRTITESAMNLGPSSIRVGRPIL